MIRLRSTVALRSRIFVHTLTKMMILMRSSCYGSAQARCRTHQRLCDPGRSPYRIVSRPALWGTGLVRSFASGKWDSLLVAYGLRPGCIRSFVGLRLDAIPDYFIDVSKSVCPSCGICGRSHHMFLAVIGLESLFLDSSQCVTGHSDWGLLLTMAWTRECGPFAVLSLASLFRPGFRLAPPGLPTKL